MDKKRVVVTGMGCITPLGHDIEDVWRRLCNGESGIAPTTLFDAATFPTMFSAEVKGFDLQAFLGDRAAKHGDASRNSAFALAAANIAWKHAGLPEHDGRTAERSPTGLRLPDTCRCATTARRVGFGSSGTNGRSSTLCANSRCETALMP